MADKWPLANGNWSVAGNWNGGTKPEDGDSIYADSRQITIDENVNLPNANFFTTTRSGGLAGGYFNLTGAWNLTCLSITPGTTQCIQISANYFGAITCPTVNSSATTSAFGINITGGTAQAFSIINANFYAGPASGRSALGTVGVLSGTITLINCTAHCTATNVANCISNGATGGLVLQGTLNLIQSSATGNALLAGAGKYDLTGTISCGGNGTIISGALGQHLTYVCTSFTFNSPTNSSNNIFVCSTSGVFDITMPTVTMHNNVAGPILMTVNVAGSNAKYTGDIVAGSGPVIQTTAAGAKLEHVGKITCNTGSGARLNAVAGSCLIVDKIEMAATGNFISWESGNGIKFKDSTVLYLHNSAGVMKTLSINGGVPDVPIPGDVRSGISYLHGTQTGTMIDHDTRFGSIDTAVENTRLAAEVAASASQS
jgi:hypothetical protein